jgi:hypothetical protein
MAVFGERSFPVASSSKQQILIAGAEYDKVSKNIFIGLHTTFKHTRGRFKNIFARIFVKILLVF